MERWQRVMPLLGGDLAHNLKFSVRLVEVLNPLSYTPLCLGQAKCDILINLCRKEGCHAAI